MSQKPYDLRLEAARECLLPAGQCREEGPCDSREELHWGQGGKGGGGGEHFVEVQAVEGRAKEVANGDKKVGGRERERESGYVSLMCTI